MGNIVNLDEALEIFDEYNEEQLKVKLLEARKIADNKWNKLPGDLSFSEYQDRVDQIYQDVHILSSRYRLIQTPVLEEAEDWEKEECLMTFEEFKECCEEGGFIDYDGSGEYGTHTHKSNISVHPSDITDGKFRTDFTHVYWYNK